MLKVTATSTIIMFSMTNIMVNYNNLFRFCVIIIFSYTPWKCDTFLDVLNIIVLKLYEKWVNKYRFPKKLGIRNRKELSLR